MAKEIKTNAMRILDKEGINYKINLYRCDDFIDAVHIADMLCQPYESSFKTLVASGKTGEHYVFCLPIARELDLKAAAKVVGEKSVELIPVKDIAKITGYIRGGCTPLGMKKRFKTVIDSSALAFSEIIISGGKIGAQIIIDPKALAKIINAEFQNIIMET